MGKINPWVIEKLPQTIKRASPLRYIVEVQPDKRAQVKSELTVLPDLAIISQPADRFVTISAPPELLPKIEAIPGVVKISAETHVWIKSPIPFLGIPTPLETFQAVQKFDPWLGKVKISSIEIPVNPAQALALSPIRALAMNNMIVFTTEDQRNYMGAPKDNKIAIKCAVADTGLTIPHFLIHPNSRVELRSVIPFEPIPFDGLGHGQWCSTCAFGDDAIHPRWGRCEGVADPEEQMHIKCLSNMGFGMNSWVLEAIYRAWEWGAKVLSMSLGGPLQGSAIEDDPQCRLINALKDEMIVVVAAGNDGVDWSIGSPGAAPAALTVGSWSMTDNGLSYFSSRGPSGEFYRDNPDIWKSDLAKAGEDLIKPDVCAPGGGRISEKDKDEQILSGVTGWYDPYGDVLPGWGVMKGTSMATPACAGLLAISYSKGIISSVADVKAKMASYQTKNPQTGYGLISWDKLKR